MEYFFNPSFQRVNRLFVLPFEDNAVRTGHARNFLRTVEIKDYNVMIDGKKFFDQPVKNDLRTYGNIQKITTGQGDDYRTDCLLEYSYFKKYYEMTVIDLRKQKSLDADPKAMK